MATKAELLAQAAAEGLDVKTSTTKKELESMLSDRADSQETTPADDVASRLRVPEEEQEVPVDETHPTDEKTLAAQHETAEASLVNLSDDNNQNGEKTNGTTLDDNTEHVAPETSVPQNGVTEVETLDVTDNEVAKAADEARTEDEVKFADESNPNQKRRDGGAPGEELDQDGNPRTGGYSYGVAADDTTGTVPNEENRYVEPENGDEDAFARVNAVPAEPTATLNGDADYTEWDVDKQQALEKSLSDADAGISARVTTSAGDYVRIKFFRNNKPLGTYRSRHFKESEARGFLDALKESVGL